MVLKMTMHWPSIEDYFHGGDAAQSAPREDAGRGGRAKHSSNKNTAWGRRQPRGSPPKHPSSPSNPQTPQQNPSSSQKRQLPNQQQQWGPTHSFSYSEEDSQDEQQEPPHQDAVAKSLSTTGGSSGGNATNPQSDLPQQERDSSPPAEDHSTSHNSHTMRALEKFWEHAGSLSRKLSFDYLEQACLVVQCQPPPSALHTSTCHHNSGNTPPQHPGHNTTSTTSTAAPNTSAASRAAADEVAHAKQVALTNNNTGSSGPEASPEPHPPGVPPVRQHDEIEVLPNHRVQVRLPPSNPDLGAAAASSSPNKKQPNNKATGKFPVETLVVNVAHHLERSISELTMRSSYAATCESLNKIPDNRRMAYYAVGKNHRTTTSSSHASNPGGPLIPRGGCNRRCYFTGKLILGGAVFYAGTVQQGLRTLVVFCLPYALGMPDKELCKGAPRTVVSLSGASSTASPRMFPRDPSRSSGKQPPQQPQSQQPLSSRRRTNTSNINSNNTVANYSIASKQESMRSRFSSSLDGDMSTIEGDLDPNWGLDPIFLLSVLPEASPDLLAQMSRLYPDQFATLPLQVRDPTRWRLYVKFCFFSGLPIAEGEMHYKVLDSIAELVYDGEEIPLSHEVMEAVNGSESAEILTLPNQKAFRYLRKHYAQQCSKLDERVFRRDSWERVAPEV